MSSFFNENFFGTMAAPFFRFLKQEKSGAIVLGVCVVVAMVMANSPWSGQYAHLFEYRLGFVVNSNEHLYFTLHHWINDGLMSMFFFVVGLELKREFVGGELSDLRSALLPVGAAVAGMMFPAVIYLAVNGGDAADGWGVPMATDIAFSLAILGMLGRKVPAQAKVFLTTLAIVDDLGAVLVIAFFYTSEISLVNIAIGAVFLGVMFIANKVGVRNIVFYGIVGIGGAWLAFLMSGIHATIAAVLAAFMIPVSPRLEHALHPVVTFIVMPVFALANAGISFAGMSFPADLLGGISLGVALGLFVGKPLGIVLSSLLLARSGVAKLSPELTARRLAGLGFLASIGFTMSMFISTLAFTQPEQLQQAKSGIFIASILGGIVGYRLLSHSMKSTDASA